MFSGGTLLLRPPQIRHQISVTPPSAAPPIGRRHERGFPRPYLPAHLHPSSAPGGPLQRNLGNRHVKRSIRIQPRGARVRGAVVAGFACGAAKTKPDGAGEGAGDSAASTDDRAALMGRRRAEFGSLNGELLTVGDRVHFELDRYDLTPEAEATLQPAGSAAAELPADRRSPSKGMPTSAGRGNTISPWASGAPTPCATI